MDRILHAINNKACARRLIVAFANNQPKGGVRLSQQSQEIRMMDGVPHDIDSERTEPDTFQRFGTMFGTAVEQALSRMTSKGAKDNVAIFVDYDNVYWTLMNRYRHDPDHEEEERNLFAQLWGHYGMDNIRSFKAYGDFEQVPANLTSLQKKRVQIRHVYANGKTEERAKNASDIELSIDAMETSYTDQNISCYVFVTADSDMIPIMSRMLYRGKRVELFYVGGAVARHTDIRNYAHESYNLLKFLSVDTTQVEPAAYVADAIVFVHNWHKQYGHTQRSLGFKWLRNGLSENLEIPSDTASKIIEILQSKDYIRENYKMVASGDYMKNVLLDETHEDVIRILATAGESEAAAGEER